MTEYAVRMRRPHAKQWPFIESPAKRRVARAGRRAGKTTAVAVIAVTEFLKGKRVLYATPTADQIQRFWFEVCRAFADPLDSGVLYKNETLHVIGPPSLRVSVEMANGDIVPGDEMRIRAKTAWNADTLRGDYADILIFDEWQLMNEDAWGLVGAPMLLDNNGDAIFIYTPPSFRSRGITKANDPMHAAKMYRGADADTSGRWAAFHFSSHDNPHIDKVALEEISQDMSSIAYRQEILAEDIEDNPGALWQRGWIDDTRALRAPSLSRVAVAVDPSATSSPTADDCGIIGGGVDGDVGYVLEDATMHGTPTAQAEAAITLYHKLSADAIIVEANNGGEWLTTVIRQIDRSVNVRTVRASRGKRTRAEPVSALYEQGRIHHVGTFAALEDELCQWEPGDPSPNRLDAGVWLFTELLLGHRRPTRKNLI